MKLGYAQDAGQLGHLMDETSDMAWVMCTDSPSEVAELLFDGHASQLGEWAANASLIRIPGTTGGRVLLKRVWMIKVGDDTAVLQTRAEKPLVVTKPPKTALEQRASSYVLRITTRWHYNNADHWTASAPFSRMGVATAGQECRRLGHVGLQTSWFLQDQWFGSCCRS